MMIKNLSYYSLIQLNIKFYFSTKKISIKNYTYLETITYSHLNIIFNPKTLTVSPKILTSKS